MLHLDLARQLAADRHQALRASAGPGRAPGARRTRRPRGVPDPVRHPVRRRIRRLLEWMDRVAPAVEATPC